jgi:uncharacterized protein YegL
MEAPRFLDEDELENPTPRTPVCLCLDVSLSMEPNMDELNKGIQTFVNSVRADEIAKYSVELAVVSFGVSVDSVCDFQTLDRPLTIPELQANGPTPMAAAVDLSLTMLENRKAWYKQTSMEYYQPWFVLMTDGQPTDPPEMIAKASMRIAEMVNARKLTVFAIGIGPAASLEALRAFSPGRPPALLKGSNFEKMFAWISQSVQQPSKSRPGEQVDLDLAAMAAWGKVVA